MKGGNKRRPPNDTQASDAAAARTSHTGPRRTAESERGGWCASDTQCKQWKIKKKELKRKDNRLTVTTTTDGGGGRESTDALSMHHRIIRRSSAADDDSS